PERDEQARPEQEPGEDLTRHVGLPEPPHDRRHEPCRKEDHDELIEQAERDLLRACADRGFRVGRGAWELRDDRRAEHYGWSIMPRRRGCRAERSCPRGSSACSSPTAGA